MTIPFLDLKAAYLELQADIDTAIARSINSGWYIGGPEVDLFEDNFARYCDAKHCVGVANGLDALHLALRAMGVGPGDEVIVPSHTYIATWLAVSHCGATPVPVEPIAGTYNIDPSLIEDAISARTKVIVPVHLYGQPADIIPILAVAKKYDLRVLEDAAQAHGARYNGKRIGAHGDAVAWSYYPGKNLGALGDGGAVTTDNFELAEEIKKLRNYGSSVKYVNDVRGFNSRLDPIQAAVLNVKLSRLDEWNSRRQKIAAIYMESLAGTGLILPRVPDGLEPVWHLFVVRDSNREDLSRRLARSGVNTLIHYPIPPHKQAAYADTSLSSCSLPIAEDLASDVLSLPIGPHLTDEAVEKVVAAVRSVC